MGDFEDGWLYEAGIGEDRAVFVANGKSVKFRLDRHGGGAKAGAVLDARFTSQWVAGKSGIIALKSGEECLLQPLPAGLSEGAVIRVEITREAIAERGGQAKKALARPAKDGAELKDAPGMLARLEQSGHPVQQVHAHDADIFAWLGWNEAAEEAATGLVQFDGGSLIISHTSAMTVIDIDGTRDNLDLSKRAARQIALSLVKLDICGNIGIDFPTLPAKHDRSVVAAVFDQHMTLACERTAINGFGFMQVIRRKTRPSLPEIIQSDRTLTAALSMLRQAERSEFTGKIQIDVYPALAAIYDSQPEYLNALRRRKGTDVVVMSSGSIPIDGGLVSRG